MNKLYLAPGRVYSRILTGMLRVSILFSFFLLVANTGWAQLSLTNGTPSATIDFSNTMQTTVGTSPSTAFAGAGFSPAPATAGRLNSNAWASTGWSFGDLAFGGSQTTDDYARGVIGAAVTQGGIYAYTGAPNSVANPALMMQPGGADFTPGTLTLKIQNNGTTLINQLAVSYNIYVRNDQARSQSFNFYYSTDNITYTQVSAVDYSTPVAADALGWVVVAGGPSRSTNITGISIGPGANFYIRWTSDDVTGAGARDEIGLDDINVTGTFVGACTPPSYAAFLSNVDPAFVFCQQMDFEFQRGNGTGGLMIVVTPGVALSAAPTSGVTYAANPNYGTGAAIGNGFVVYNSNTVASGTPGGVGSFTLTGLTPNSPYRFYYFEYNISVPCYYVGTGIGTSPNWFDNFDEVFTNPTCATSSGDLFRSATTGNWADCRTWQSSNNGGASWVTSDIPPTSASAGITVTFTHTVDISCPASMDQLGINGTLTLSDDGVINLNNGAGADIDIRNAGVLKIQSSKNYTSSFAYTGGPTINVSTGGKLTVGNGGPTPGYSPLGYTSGLGIWNTDAIFEWNTTDPFITSGVTYFPDAAAGTIPIFRVTKTPSLQPGANANTTWNGLMEVNSSLTLKLAGVKTFRNGIIGSADLFQDDNCGQFVINGTTAKLGGSGALNLNASGAAINLPSLTTMISNKQVNLTAGVGELTVNGTLYCGANNMTGSGVFTLASGGTLGIGSNDGITPTGGGTGNIQVGGTRSYNVAANYVYNGVSNQITGTGLPATINTLTIANTGGSGNNIVTNTRAGTTTINSGAVGSFALTSGLFIIGATKDISIADNGGIAATAGNFAGASSGTVTFLGTGTVSGAVDFYPDVYQTPAAIKGVNYGSSSILHGLLQLNANSFVNINAPTYLSTSLLKYNTGGIFNRNVEWSTTSGNGYPYHVQVSNNTTIDPTGTALSFNNTTFKTAGNVTIDNGSAIYLDYSGHNMLTSMEVGGNLLLNGALSGSQVIGGDIKVAGNWTRSSTGSFFPNDRAVFFNGSTNSTITANNGETFHYLYFTKNIVSTAVSLIDNISVTKEFGINTGTLDLQAKDVTLVSTTAATASFANFGAGTPANANIIYSGIGRFVVERYIPTGASHAKSWQFLAVPTNNAGVAGGQTVNASWQEGAATANANPVAGYGTQITSNISPLPSMFDVLTPAGPSMKTYNPATNGWDGILNTTTAEVYNQKGYMLFVRGNRSVTTSGAAANATTLRTRGKIMEAVSNIPPVTNVGSNLFESIGNPYASAIDFSNDAAVIKSANVQKVFYVWDPKLAGTYGYGRFQTFTKGAGSDYTVSPGGGSYGSAGSVNNIIQSGQAFFVHTSGGTGTVTFTENSKVSGSSLVYKPVDMPVNNAKQLRNNLYVIQNGEPVLIDGVLNEFDRSFSNYVDVLDALKMNNSSENISIFNNNYSLAVERKADIKKTDTIFYQLGQMKLQQYRFEFTAANISRPGLDAFLEDSYLQSKTNISLTDTTRVDFSVSNDPGSYHTNRFRLVFLQKSIPVKFTDIRAQEQNRDITVTWSVTDQSAISYYEVERSADGINFTVMHTEPVNTATNTSYSWLDKEILDGINFYRIRSIGAGNEISYSKQVSVTISDDHPGFVIYPNPVKDKQIGLRFNKLPSGNYKFSLYNAAGQVIIARDIYHPGGSVRQQLQLQQAMAKGIYRLEIIGAGGLKQVEKLLVD